MSSFAMKTGDTLPAIRQALTQGGAPIDLTGSTVVFRMRLRGGALKFSRAAAIVSATSGVVQYDWQSGDTDTAGVYLGEWVVTTGGGVQTVPTEGYVTVSVVASVA